MFHATTEVISYMDMDVRAKIVLQNRESLLYLQLDGKWTSDMEGAARFKHVTDASFFAREKKMEVLDIVMSFGDPRYDVRLPASS
jgi:hypothetical protein